MWATHKIHVIIAAGQKGSLPGRSVNAKVRIKEMSMLQPQKDDSIIELAERLIAEIQDLKNKENSSDTTKISGSNQKLDDSFIYDR
jgi:hypothetical protein